MNTYSDLNTFCNAILMQALSGMQLVPCTFYDFYHNNSIMG